MNYLNCLNKKDKIIIVVLCIFLFVTAVNAQERILNLVLIKDESGIRIMDRTVSTSKIESESINLIGYKFVVKDLSDTNIVETINFGFKDNVAILSVPVSQNSIKGEVYDDKDNLILEVDLYSHIDVGLCGDSACSGDETHESCPQDCFLQREISLEKETKSESKLPLIILYSAIGIVVFLIIIFSIILLKRKIRPREKFIETEEESSYESVDLEQQLQNYIQQAKQQGLSEEEIKNDLLQTGWPSDLIEKNLK